jgi:hypothetical protein
MYRFLAMTTAIATLIGLLPFFIILSSLLGALFGWVVGLFFPVTMALFSSILGVQAEPWQLGLLLGFISGFFRNSIPFNK